MSSRGIGLGGRLAALALAMTLVLVLAGDGGRAATVPAVINGQDPLEVLSLKVRPNVVVVLDSSGSMKWSLDPTHLSGGEPANGGDHPRSKIWQAKQVLKTIVQTNQDKVSFLFGQYTNGSGPRMQNRGAGQNRFTYWTTDQRAPTMQTGTELTVQGAVDDNTFNRGLQSWQVIYNEWNTLWFEESNGAVCEATLPGTFPKFYGRGGSGTAPAVSTTPQNLSFDLQTAMNSATCSGGGSANTYNVTYNGSRFVFTATGPNDFRLRPRSVIPTNNISEALGGVETDWNTPGGTLVASDLDRTSTYTEIDTTTSHLLQVGAVCDVFNADRNVFNGTWTVISIVDSNTFRLSGPTGGSFDGNFANISCSPSGEAANAGPGLTLLHRDRTPPSDNPSWGSSWTGFHNAWEEEVPAGSGTMVTNYQLRASRFFNGEVLRVTADGQICDMTFPAAADRTDPPTVTLQEVTSTCGSDVGPAVTFTWAGAYYTGGSNFCDGFLPRVDLIPCDLLSPPAPTQFSTIGPWLVNEAAIDADGTLADYTERMDGTWATATYPPASAGGVKGWGSTPIAHSLDDIKDIFVDLWNNGQTGSTNSAGAPPYQLDPIKNHLDPKEKTIVLFITDGDDTCAAGSGSNQDALYAARSAELLYRRVDPNEPASSVQTFVIGYGGGASPSYIDWIAWGGSGLGDVATGQPDVPISGDRWAPSVGTSSESAIHNELKALRARCTTCTDGFIAPDAATLAATLQAIIDQGAAEGEFSAQQSVTESIFEYVDRASNATDTFDPRAPSNRYEAIVPTRIISSFTLPGFRGRLRALQNDGAGGTLEQWDAGEKLRDHVANTVYGVGSCDTSARGGAVGECTFNQLHAGATTATVATSAAKIKRRVYTTERNGVYTFDVPSLIAGTANQRVDLWPPAASLIPTNYTSEALLPGGLSFDEALGLPTGVIADPAAELQRLQDEFGACVGTNRPWQCNAADDTTKMLAARREAREMILAFMAGAEPVPLNPGVKRASSSGGGVTQGDILYRARSWVLADSELATPAVVTQPLPSEPVATPWLTEYALFRDGVRNVAGKNPDNSGTQIKQGFGLRNPDNDLTVGADQNDTRNSLKPVMTVVYAPANDMLHAFRAGPNVSPSTSCDDVANATHECGGQELWGFVPFDQLGALGLRLIHEPQGRDNHVYMLARGARFADVFVAVPAADSPPITATVGGVSTQLNGVWRRIMFVPRGIGGKYMTALDVTGPGAYTEDALSTLGPIPLWSRGNPDTIDGTAATVNNGSPDDRLAYSAMGETWSLPTIAYRDKSANPNTVYNTARRPDGVDYVLYMGSGYGATGEGTTFFTIDALSGDVIEDVDVEIAAAANGLTRMGLPYDNALVANAVGFNPAVFSLLTTVHPAASSPTRVYIGDIHGRLWKILTARPDVAIPVADLGEDQPVGTSVSLLGMPPSPDTPVPYIFVSSGADRRADGPFKNFGFRDDGTDTQVTIGSGVVANEVTTFPPAVSLHTRAYDQGTPDADCGYTKEAVFRGTIQPATAFECSSITSGNCQDPVGRVFFGGTRLNLPNTRFAPPTPFACGLGEYPCRSSFDSIIYALGAKTGLAAYDLNASGDDAYRIFRDNRISAIAMLADPDPARGGSSFNPDEGEMKGTPKPPPPPGVPPTSSSATASVIMRREPGQPPPSVHYGSTVCQ